METLLDLITGGGLVLTGYALGRFMPARRRAKKIQAVCGCGHHFSYHDPETRECHGRKFVGHDYGKAVDVYEDCTCRRYAGPEPLPEMYAREIASE